MLAPALRRHGSDRALHDLQQRLLHALARYVAGDRGVVRLAADLIDLVDVDDAALRALDVIVSGLQQLENDVFHILTDVAGLGEGRGVRHGEGHVENASQGLSQQGLAAAGRADQQDVRLGQLDVIALGAVREPLVVVVHGNGEDPLGVVLPNHVVIQNSADIGRRRHTVARLHEGRLVLLANDVHAQLDALIADEYRRPRNQLPDLVLALSAEGAVEGVFTVAAARLGHCAILLLTCRGRC